MPNIPGTNFNGKLSEFVNISLTNESGHATNAECVGDPNTVALEENTYALGCLMTREDVTSGGALYENKGNKVTPQWYLVTTA